ncbi:hypothetical protein GOBAR_AA03832 [Gossypium barbadense]|uniref:Glutathione reductase n=1 Tax=Gossypium barbadense TaxID=3634 RepID=A0A2P5YMH4_GOSBA|nr:hypothetical protein GOBAR_AA03832 [Gossypium barbadense]
MSTLFSYLIKIYAEADLSQKALNVFYKMLEFNVKPLLRHLNHILELLVSHRDFIMPVFDLFKIAYKYGVFPNTKSYNILMGAFCLNGDLSIAYKLFKKLFERGVMPDVESYRILMQRVCKKSQVNRAVDLLEDMLNKRFVPDSLSYTTLLNSLCRKKKLREGRAMDAIKLKQAIMARKMLVDGELNQTNKEGAEYDFDLFVIGAGSGGVRAARFSANYGAKVGICELPFHPISSEVIGGVGGTCVIRGCVPKKILVYGATFGGEIEDARNYGWEVNEKLDFNWKKLLQKKTDEINRLNGIYKRLLSNASVKLLEGEGKIIGPNKVEVTQPDGTKLSYSAKHILIATGSRAHRPPIPGQELAITSDEALSLDDLPKHAVVFGGGYIAVEFASIWRGLGATVDLFYRKELPLRGFDDEMRAVVARNLEGRGIKLHPQTNLTELVKTDNGIKVITDHGGELIADVVLFATALRSTTFILQVDEYSRTNIPSIWAVGDVTNRMNLTPVALMEGTCFAKTVFGGESSKPDYRNIPCAVFSIPPLSIVGLSEEEAIEQVNGDVLVFTSTFNPMKNTVSGRQEKTIMKLVVDAETDKVLGASMCGPDAPEIMQGIAVALKCGATKAQFDSTVGIHPSAAEEFVTMRSVSRRVTARGKAKTNL